MSDFGPKEYSDLKNNLDRLKNVATANFPSFPPNQIKQNLSFASRNIRAETGIDRPISDESKFSLPCRSGDFARTVNYNTKTNNRIHVFVAIHLTCSS